MTKTKTHPVKKSVSGSHTPSPPKTKKTSVYKQKSTYVLLISFEALLLIVFCFLLFKDLSRPLFWADESMTVVGAERVLQFGFPKVHDGKNVLYDLDHPDKKLGINEKTDAYVGGANWGMYYYGALPVRIAERFENPYTKTFIIRSAFVLLGLLGLFFLALLAMKCMEDRNKKLIFLVFFTILMIFSVPLILHFREARYYSLLTFLIAILFFIYLGYRIFNKLSVILYLIFTTVLLWLLFITFSPSYFISIVSLFVFELLLLLVTIFKKKDPSGDSSKHYKKSIFLFFRNILPVLISFLAIIPLLFYFRTFHIAEEMAKFNGFNKDFYLNNLSVIGRFFTEKDLLLYVLILKSVQIILVLASLKRLSNEDRSLLKVSVFFSLFFIIYFFLIARIPNFIFTRYLIPVIPVLSVIFIMDFLNIISILRIHKSKFNFIRYIVIIVFMIFLVLNIRNNRHDIGSFFEQVQHKYYGPLDYIIPFVQKEYNRPDTLVIATNYEETSFMYYLRSKVTIGYVGNNLGQDSLIQPDIICFRRAWGRYPEIFNRFLQKKPYQTVSFPIKDIPFNNIPELNFNEFVRHQYLTPTALNDNDKMIIFLKKSQ